MASFTGDAAVDDSLNGTTDNDSFDMTQTASIGGAGGSDYVFADAGDDTFYFGAALTAADTVRGGDGYDALLVAGDYSGGLTFAAEGLEGVEYLAVSKGYNYAIATANENVIAGGALDVDGRDLAAQDLFIFDGSAEQDGFFVFLMGAALSADDRLWAGSSTNDSISLNGDYTKPLVLDAETIKNIEILSVSFGNDYNLVLHDGNVAAGGVFTLSSASSFSGDRVRFDGSDESNAAFAMQGGGGRETLIGGRGADTLSAGDGADRLLGHKGRDMLIGNEGDDVIRGGRGLDTLTGGLGNDRFVVGNSIVPGNRVDCLIGDLQDGDVIDLSKIDADAGEPGDQAFLVVASLQGKAGEAALVAVSDGGNTQLWLDMDGDAEADIVVLIPGDHTAFNNFIL